MRNRRKFLVDAILATAGLCAAEFAYAKPVLRQRTSNSYPRSFRDKNGVWSGFEIDMSQLLCNRVAHDFAPLDEYMNWTRSLRSLKSGRLDLLTFVAFREERKEFLDYIGPYDVEELILLVHKDNKHMQVNTLQDLLKTKLPIEKTKDAAISEEFDKRFNEDPEFASHFSSVTSTGGADVLLRNQKMAARVERKRVSGAITDWYVFRELINPLYPANETGYDVNNIAGVSLGNLSFSSTYLAVSKHVPKNVRDQLRIAYAETRTNGEFDALWKKWYGERALPPVS